MKELNNNDFRRRLIMYLDGALDSQESREFLVEIKDSPECLAQLKKEQSFRELLRKKMNRKSVPSALVDGIKSKINISHSS